MEFASFIASKNKDTGKVLVDKGIELQNHGTTGEK